MTTATLLRKADVIGVVASTGGPNALTRLLAAFPQPLPAPMVVVQHMPLDFTARLADRLRTVGAYDVREARDGDRLAPGLALVAPGGAHLRVVDGTVKLTSEAPVGGLRPRGDLTLQDLADCYGSGALAVILTGMGDDGLRGAREVFDAGGQVVAQDAESAAVDGMPKRVRESGLATVTAEPAELAHAMSVPFGISAAPRGVEDRRRAPRGLPALPRSTALAPGVIEGVRLLLKTTDDADLDSLRDTYLTRRVAAFVRRHGLPADEQLLDELRAQPRLRSRLLGRLHVHVTTFFRDVAHWQALSEEVLGSLPDEPRLWSAGCADGSEAYSLALLCLQRGRRPHVWATDVDDEVLERCRQATYRDDDLATVPEPLRRRYFRPHPGGGLEARTELRSTVEVACHDALRDELPARPFDLVACRNLVIYLGPAGRERLYERLARAVRPGGVLFTGAADSFHDADRFGFAHLGGTLFRRLGQG